MLQHDRRLTTIPVSRPVSRLLALALACLLVGAACKSDLSRRVGAGREARSASAQDALAELIAVRAKTIADRFAAQAGLEDTGERLALWRRSTTKDGLAERAQTLHKAHLSSPLGRKFESASQFLGEQAAYWADTKGKLNAYMDFLALFLARSDGPQDVFVEHARFERQYVHAANLFRLRDLSEDRRITGYYRFWKYAFEFKPAHRGEAFVVYVNRLCMTKLRDYCLPLMWEHRPYALKKPYMEQLLADLGDFRRDYPQSAFLPVIRLMQELYTEELQELPTFEEYPILADGRTDKDAVGGNELVFGPRGVAWNNDLLLELPGDRVALEEAERKTLLAAFDERLDDIIEAEAEVVPDPAIDRVVTQFDRNVPLRELTPLLDALLDHQLIVLGLLTRRRADDSNRKVGTYLAAFFTPPPLDAEEEKRKTPETREAEARERLEYDPRRRVPTQIAGMTCRALGRTREMEAMTKQATTYVAYGPETISTGPVTAPESYAAAMAEAGSPTATRETAAALADPAPLERWTDAPGEAIVLAFHEALTWEQAMLFLQRAHIRCKDTGCTEAEERTHQIHIALCR